LEVKKELSGEIVFIELKFQQLFCRKKDLIRGIKIWNYIKYPNRDYDI